MVVHLSAPVEVCRQRDPNGLYESADRGELGNFPGVSAEYEAPQDPDLTLPTDQLPVDQCVERIVSLLEQRKIIW